MDQAALAGPDLPEHQRLVFAKRQIQGASLQQFLNGVSEDLGQPGIGVHKPPLLQHVDAHQGFLGEAAILRLRLTAGLFRPLVVCDLLL